MTTQTHPSGLDPDTMPETSPLAVALRAAETGEVPEGPGGETPIPGATADPERSAQRDYYGDTVGVEPIQWAGGAKTFDEWDEFQAAQHVELAIDSQFRVFEGLSMNIRNDPTLLPAEKADTLAQLSTEAADRIRSAQALAEQDAPNVGLRDLQLDRESEGFRADGVVFKDRNDQWRWFTIHTNNYRDRTGQHFSAQSHKDFVDWCNDTKQYPPLRLWHVPYDVGPGDMIDFDGNFVLASGTFHPGMGHMAKSLAEMDDLACSHGFRYPLSELRGDTFHAYRSFEISVLPRKAEANEITAFFMQEAPMPIAQQTRDFLKEVGGEGFDIEVDTFLTNLKSKADAKGVSFRSLVEGYVEPAGDGQRAEGDETAAATPAAPVAVADAPAATPAAAAPAPVAQPPAAAATPVVPAAAPAAPATAVAPTPEAPASATAPAPVAAEPAVAVAPVAMAPAPVAAAPTAATDTPGATEDEGERALAALIGTAVKSAVDPIGNRLDQIETRLGITPDEAVAAAVRSRSSEHAASRDGLEVPTGIAEDVKAAAGGDEAPGPTGLGGFTDPSDPTSPYRKMLGGLNA